MTRTPRIACVHIPRFAVEVERQRPFSGAQDRRRNIASRLILIGDATVSDCSLGAEASGVRRGMRMSEAIGLCSQAVVLPPDIPYYEKRFGEALDLLEALSPVVEAGGPSIHSAGSGPGLDTAYLSLNGLPAVAEIFAEELIAGLHRVLQLMASVGIATGKFTSKMAASTTRPGASRVIPPGGEPEFLATLPVDYLPVSEATRWRLNLLGLTTMGDIARLPLSAFQSQFGLEGKRCWELAQGIDNEPLVRRLQEEAIVRRLQLPAPAATLDAIMAGAERLVRAAYADERRGGRWVRKAVVRAALEGGGTWELPVPFREALADPRDAWFAIKGAITRRPPERPVEELEVEFVGLSGESGKQATMFEGKGKLWQQVEEAVRQLGAQREQPPLSRVVKMEPWSRIPERRAALADFEAST